MAFKAFLFCYLMIAAANCKHIIQKKRGIYGEAGVLSSGTVGTSLPITFTGGYPNSLYDGAYSGLEDSSFYNIPTSPGLPFFVPSAVFPSGGQFSDFSHLPTIGIGAPVVLGHHIKIFNRVAVPIPQPYPVPIHRDVAVSVAQPVPVPVERPVPVPVPQPYPVPVVRAVGVPVEKQVPYPVPQAVPYPVYQPVSVPVTKPVAVPVIKDVPVPVESSNADQQEEQKKGW